MDTERSSPGPILTAHLFSPLDTLLVELLRSLSPAEWDMPTLAGQWRVRHVAAHLLDTALRRLSLCRDRHYPSATSPDPARDLVALINHLNAEGVGVFGRLSPRLLIDQTARVTAELSDYFRSLDPLARADFAVSWAGETQSANWFDMARELTERWHHQQQIRLAVDKPGIETRALYHPVLDCFMRALPFAYRRVVRPPGTLARFMISGSCGGHWLLQRGTDAWQLVSESSGPLATEVSIPQGIAWRLFTKGIPRDVASPLIQVSGDTELGRHVLTMIAIVG